MGLTRPSFGQQGCCGSPFQPAEWRLGTETLGNWYKWQFRGKAINLILDQVGHYKNWREWSHTVHNLDKGEGSRRREDGRREDYSRDHR